MKNIFVTVAEFLENGGYIELGRDIYTQDIGYTKVGYFLELGDSAGLFYYTSIMQSGTIHRETHRRYVQVPCTPHYI